MTSRLQAIICLIVLTTGLILYSCREEDAYHKTGIAFGYDMRDCVCCGGLFVDYQSDTLLFPEIPAKIVTWEQLYGFPLSISFDFEKMESSCGLDWYRMTYLELVDHP
jgi:hypothetical protein